jgi:hypothetical protein
MSFEFLFRLVEDLDARLADLLHGAPPAVVLLLAVALGLRHATDPDHLAAVTSLIAGDERGPRRGAELGAWWGAGHASVLVLAGLPLIALDQAMPAWLQAMAERAVGAVIVALAARVLWRWARGRPVRHAHRPARGPLQAFGIGTLHGLAGTGAVVLLLIAALPGRLEAALALAVFAPMTAASMALCSAGFGWVLARPALGPAFTTAGVPLLGAMSLLFGAWYVGVA